MKGLIADEMKLAHKCMDDDAQIHEAIARTYQRIIDLNDEKTDVWQALVDLEQ